MSRAIQVDGHLGPVFGGLGEHSGSRSAAAANATRVGPMRMFARRGVAQCAVFPLSPTNEVPRSGSILPWPVETRVCGEGTGIPCDVGMPVASLSGLMGKGDMLRGKGDLPRDRLGDLGKVAFCNDLNAALAELRNILDRSGYLLSEASRTSAEATYSDLSSFAVYVPFLGTDCERNTAEVRAMANSLRAELGTAAPPPLRPEIDAGGEPSSGLPTWLKVAIFGGIGVVGLAAFGITLSQFNRLFGRW